MNGRSVHRRLRSTPVDVTMADLEHPLCLVCHKILPDDPSGKRKYCSGMCQGRAARARAGWVPRGRRRKLTDAQRAEIRALGATGLVRREIAERFGVSVTTVEQIVNKGVVDMR